MALWRIFAVLVWLVEMKRACLGQLVEKGCAFFFFCSLHSGFAAPESVF